MIELVNETVDFLRKEGITEPEVGIILGTGLGKLVNEIKNWKNHRLPNDTELSNCYNWISQKGKTHLRQIKGKKL